MGQFDVFFQVTRLIHWKYGCTVVEFLEDFSCSGLIASSSFDRPETSGSRTESKESGNYGQQSCSSCSQSPIMISRSPPVVMANESSAALYDAMA